MRAALFLLALLPIAAAVSRAKRAQTAPGLEAFDRDSLLNMSREELVNLVIAHQGGAGNFSSGDPIYWWYYPTSDCAYDDVTGSCSGQTVAQCEQTCLNTPGCGGFNYPHGVLKKTDCMKNMAYESTVGLYIKMSTPQPPPPPPSVNFPPIWPIPSSYTNGSMTVTVNSVGFVFKALNPSQDLQNAFDRFAGLYFPHTAEPATGLAIIGVIVNVTDVNVPLQLGVDESYQLIVPSAGGSAVINAATVYGAYHALETLSQLITFNFDTKSYSIAAAPWTINDTPRFSHREVLVDSR